MYSAMLTQHGIRVGSANVTPIWLELETDEKRNIINVKNVEVSDTIYNVVDSNHAGIAIQYIPHKTLLDEIDLIPALQEPMTKFFPNYAVQAKIQLNQVTVEQYKKMEHITHRLTPGEEGYGEYKYRVYNKHVKTKRIYCKNDEELTTELQKLVAAENEARGLEFQNLADQIYNLTAGGNRQSKLLEDTSAKYKYIRRILKKYIEVDSP